MGVVRVDELWKPRRASVNEKFESSYTRTFQVITDSPATAGQACILAVGIEPETEYACSTEFDGLSHCRTVTAECEAEDGKKWLVTVEYGKVDPQQTQNPLSMPLVLEWGEAQYEIEIDQDVNGNAICNKVGDPIPGVKREASRPILTVRRNEQSDPSQVAGALKETVNADPFYAAGTLIGDSQCVKFLGVEAKMEISQVVGRYFVCDYKFSVRDETWKLYVLNQGYRELVTQSDGSKKPQQILIGGSPATSPCQLKQDGTKAGPDDPPYFLEFDIYFSQDFSVFGF